jgi:hypothetical protein
MQSDSLFVIVREPFCSPFTPQTKCVPEIDECKTPITAVWQPNLKHFPIQRNRFLDVGSILLVIE